LFRRKSKINAKLSAQLVLKRKGETQAGSILPGSERRGARPADGAKIIARPCAAKARSSRAAAAGSRG
jgi:hypothetical protein